MNGTRYELVAGRNINGKLSGSLTMGVCFLNEGDMHYTVKLMMFPGQTYYLVKNRNSQDRYTVFAKLMKDEAGSRFQNPVGSGRLRTDLSSHMELYFPLLKAQVFMCLFPQGVK